jgi:hypothetical protein
MKSRRIARALGALGLLIAVSSAGCTFQARGHLRSGAVVAYEAPPPPKQETYSARAGHVWINGRWNWQNGGWQWVPGHWERERSGYAYQEGRWEQRNNQYHWTEGQWVVVGSGHVQTGGGYDRPQDRDHRDGRHGTVVTPPPPQPHGPGHNHGQGPLTATNAAGTVVVGAGGVRIVGPTSAPPPIRVENPGPSRGSHVWIRGRWQWSNGQYEWVPGHWEREKAGQQWYDGEWQNQGGQWVWVEGGWRASASGGVQIRDRRTH